MKTEVGALEVNQPIGKTRLAIDNFDLDTGVDETDSTDWAWTVGPAGTMHTIPSVTVVLTTIRRMFVVRIAGLFLIVGCLENSLKIRLNRQEGEIAPVGGELPILPQPHLNDASLQ